MIARTIKHVEADLAHVAKQRLEFAMRTGRIQHAFFDWNTPAECDFVKELNQREARLRLELHTLKSHQRVDNMFYLFFIAVAALMIYTVITP